MLNDERPTGTVTFVFTDIEGSTALWQQHPDAMAEALLRHDAIIKTAVAQHGGMVFSTGGDGFAAAFARAGDALKAAVDFQSALASEVWPTSIRLSVRAGLHTGEAIERDGDYFGPSVNRAARLMSAGHGDQILCSETTHGVLLGQLPAAVQLVDLGRVRLKGFSSPERVFGVVAPGLRPEFPPLVEQEGDVGSRPGAPDLVVGRAQELDEIVELLTSRRVVTLTGTGGVGKTTLALAAIDRVAEKFPDGVWWIDLATVDANDDILPVIASVVRVRDHLGEGFMRALATSLADQRMLLVLDNCEHVLGAATAIVGHLVGRCPGLVVLSTSRVRLGVTSERDLAIRPLRVDGERSAALELLIERIGDRGRGDDPDELAALEDITRRLDGLPLALELAAARCRSMSPIAVAERLRDRIRLPAARGAVAGSRATLDGTVQWSYDLLTTTEQEVLARLSVFAGTFSLDAAEHVACANADLDGFDADDAIAALVEHSLIEQDGGRYRMLETTRQFADARLDDAGAKEAFESAHVQWVVTFLRTARVGLRGPDERRWVERMDADWANVRAAFHRSMKFDDPNISSELVLLLFFDAAFRRPEAGGWMFAAYEHHGSVEHLHRHELIGAVGWLTWERGDLIRAVELGHAAMEADPAPGTAIDRLPEWALVAGLAFSGKPSEARGVIDSVLRTLSDEPFLQVVWNYLFTVVCSVQGKPSEGSGAAIEAERIARALDNPTSLAFAFWARSGASDTDDPHLVAEFLSIAAGHCRAARLTVCEQVIEQGILGLRRRLGYPVTEVLSGAIQQARVFARHGFMVFGWPALITISFCLHDLGKDEAAAICLHVRSQSPVNTSYATVEVLLRDLTEALGEPEMARLEDVARGLDFAAMLNLAESHL